ncbi:MAG: chemotaxis protein CheA [Candidatus Sulfotelmatobacter sp.]|jgi:two-component system, chemotaxis family, sensor kinase CheA
MTDQYRQAYQEEAREVLVELESALLELNERRDDAELVGRTFRALHTIKGSGAMFGFDDIAAFTHHVENAFDQVRNGSLAATPDLINLTLAAVDQIKAMLDEAAGQGRAEPAASADILAKLSTLTGAQQAVSTKETAVGEPPPVEPAGALRPWHIRFAPGADLTRNGTNPLLLLRELRQLGDLVVTANPSSIPALAEIDPQRCYISWEMELTTGATQDAIRDVFMFVEDCCQLAIEAADLVPTAESIVSEIAAADERRSGAGRRSTDKDVQAASIRVAALKLDQLVDLVGQLVTVQARLAELSARSEDRDMQAAVEEVEALTAELRETSMSMRTVSLRSTFERMKRLVYDLGRTLHKKVELSFEGGDTELDKTVIDQLHDPLMHLIRNCMDHGIESHEVRQAAGKSSTANVHLSARHAGAQVLISVSDDGKGIDCEAVRARAVEKGLIAADARLSESEVFSLILAAGFSTAREVTDVSGRGVGMDVVRRNVEALRGSIEISSQPGLGSTVALRLPLTLAIIDGLLVRVGEARYVMPLANTTECVELTKKDIENANGKHLANIRGEIVPYIRLSEYLQMRVDRPEREQVMIAETEHGRYGFVVDQVLGDHQTVIKNLGRLYHNVQIISGATILGDGSVALILDLHRLTQEVIRKMSLGRKTDLAGANFRAVAAAV